MIVNVKKMSRKQFEKFGLYSQYGPNPLRDVYISIYGSLSYENKRPRVNAMRWLDGIQLKFDDIDGDLKTKTEKPISEEQCAEIINKLVQWNSEKDSIEIIVHCFAGVSRSAAIAKFINDTFTLKLTEFNDLRVYNRYVYSMLFETWKKLQP